MFCKFWEPVEYYWFVWQPGLKPGLVLRAPPRCVGDFTCITLASGASSRGLVSLSLQLLGDRTPGILYELTGPNSAEYATAC